MLKVHADEFALHKPDLVELGVFQHGRIQRAVFKPAVDQIGMGKNSFGKGEVLERTLLKILIGPLGRSARRRVKNVVKNIHVPGCINGGVASGQGVKLRIQPEEKRLDAKKSPPTNRVHRGTGSECHTVFYSGVPVMGGYSLMNSRGVACTFL